MIIGDLFAGVGGMSQGFRMAGDFSVAFAESLDFSTQFFHNANHLMPDGYSRHSFWYAAMFYMQVAGADATHGHADDGIRWLLNRRLGLIH